MTKEEIIKQVTDIVREKGKIAPGELNKKLRWNDEELAEIGQLFGLAGSEAKRSLQKSWVKSRTCV